MVWWGGAMSYRGLIFMVVLAGLLLGSPSMAVSPYDDVLVDQARKNLAEGNYEEALDQLTQAWQKGTRTPEKAYHLGVLYRRTLNYPKSREYLEEAVRIKPNYPEARRLLADTLLSMEKPQDALPHLQELERVGYQPGQTAYLLGMTAAKQKRFQEALDYFHKAQADPAVAADAKLQMSMALAGLNRLKEARKSLEELAIMAPTSDAAGFAQRYAAAIDKRLKETRPFRFYASTSIDFDSNVTVQPGDPSAAALVSGQGDMAYTYAGTFEYNFFANQPYSVLTQYAFSQTFHPRLTKYDTLNNTMGLIPGYQFQNGRLFLPLYYYYSDLENDKYYTAYVATPSYLYLYSPKVGLEVGGRVAQKYYWFPVGLPQDNRSAKNAGASMGIYYFLKEQEGYLQARLVYEHDFAYGSNWSNSSYRLFLLAVIPVSPRLKISSFLDFIYQPYDHANIAFGQFAQLVTNNKRLDKIMTYGIIGTYQVYKGLDFNVHYYFIRDNSNLALYDYHRHIVGCQLGFRY